MFLRHQLAWNWALVIVRGTFHHLICDQLVHLMMSPCNQPLHHTEFTSRTERGCPGRPLPSRTVLCFRHQLAWDWALAIARGTFHHHLVCDQLVHLMMSSYNQSLHHTEFTSRTERGCPGRPLPSRTVLCFRHQLAWDWALVIVRGTFHHLVCDQLVHLMMPPCNQPLHHTEFTSRTERGYPNRPFPSRTTSSLRTPGRVSLAHSRTLILLRQWPPPDTTPDAAGLLSPPPLLPSRTMLCRETFRFHIDLPPTPYARAH